MSDDLFQTLGEVMRPAGCTPPIPNAPDLLALLQEYLSGDQSPSFRERVEKAVGKAVGREKV